MLSRLKVVHKLAISTLAFMCCISALIYFYTDSIDKNIDFSLKELEGNEYQRALMPLLYDVSQLQVQHIQGLDTSAQAAKIEKGLRALQDVQARLGGSLQFTQEGLSSRGREQLKLETVLGVWKKLQAGLPGGYQEEGYKTLLASIRGMIAHAGDTSNLILDPDLDSYYLMDITLLALPQTIDRLGQINASLLGKTSLDSQEMIELAVAARMVKEADFDRITADFDTTFKEDPNFGGVSPTLQSKLQPAIGDFNAAYGDLIEQMNNTAHAPNADNLKRVSELAMAAQSAANNMWNVAIGELDALITTRVDNYDAQRTQVLALCGLGLLLSIAFFIVVVRDIINPLNDIQATMKILNGGSIRHPIPHTSRKDEIGEMAFALEAFQKSLVENEDLKSQQEANKQKAEQDKKKQLAELADSFESSVKDIVMQTANSAREIQSSAEGLTYIASDTQERSSTVVNTSSEAAQISSNVAAASEELTASIKEISVQTQRSSHIAEEATAKAEAAKQVIELLSEKSGHVSEIIAVITGVAEQINLLALNATIESARAGEAGKGFAVVASEVKNLATQVSKATGEITQQINEMQAATQTSVKSVMEILGVISQVFDSTSAVAAAVEEQSAVTNDIAKNITQAASGTRDISSNMLLVQDGARQTGDESNKVLEAAQGLVTQSTALQQKVEAFLVTIRQA